MRFPIVISLLLLLFCSGESVAADAANQLVSGWLVGGGRLFWGCLFVFTAHLLPFGRDPV